MSPDLATLVLAHIDREYPYRTGLTWSDPADVVEPRKSSPVFGGSFDWHSSVHSHWTLVKLLRLDPSQTEIADLLDRRFTRSAFAVECASIERPDRRGFEMPYGIAWFLLLAAELSALAAKQPARSGWSNAMAPLYNLARQRFGAWLAALVAPIRSGEHSQSALAMTLAFEAAGMLGDGELTHLVSRRAVDFYAADVDAPFAYEPSAYDFVSPALAEAELLAAVLPVTEFRAWWQRFATNLDPSFAPVTAADRADGKLAHWDGLNLSRAWMLSTIAGALPAGPDRERLATLAVRHREAGMAGLDAATYAGTHWLPTFALRARLKAGAEST